jgi:protease I
MKMKKIAVIITDIFEDSEYTEPADVLRGRKLTGYKSIIQDIKNAGAEYIDSEVVVDGNLVSSRHPGDLPAFISESLKKLK